MSFCTKCGREILDESLGCPYCSVHDNTSPGETNIAQENMTQPEMAQNETHHEENDVNDINDINHEDNTMQPVQNQETQSNTAQPEEPAEKVDSFTVEDSKGTYQRFENTAQSNPNTQNSGTWQQNNHTQNNGTWQQENSQTQYRPVTEQTIHPALKAVIIVLIVLVNGLGAVAGLIAGLILMKSPVEDYRSFGKLMTIVSAVMLALSVICCVVMLAFNVMIPGSYYYH